MSDSGLRAWWVGWERGCEILARGGCTCRCFLQTLCLGAPPSPLCDSLAAVSSSVSRLQGGLQDLLGLARAGL